MLGEDGLSPPPPPPPPETSPRLCSGLFPTSPATSTPIATTMTPASDTCISQLKVVTMKSEYWGNVYEVEEEYNHLLGHCVQPPSIVSWLSNLPDHLISHILCSLTPKEAVQTCILSKRWRYLWSFMPNLCFQNPASVDYITNVLKSYKSVHVGLLDLGGLEVEGRFPTSHEIDSWLSLACS